MNFTEALMVMNDGGQVRRSWWSSELSIGKCDGELSNFLDDEFCTRATHVQSRDLWANDWEIKKSEPRATQTADSVDNAGWDNVALDGVCFSKDDYALVLEIIRSVVVHLQNLPDANGGVLHVAECFLRDMKAKAGAK